MTLALVPVARLSELEAVIERGQPTFIEVGLALAEIRDQKLYKAEYGTFDAYCRERWGWSRSYGYRLISAAELSPTGDIPNERQARAILHPEPVHEAYPALLAAIQALEGLAYDVNELATSVPVKSQERWVRRLRRAGTFLGHIAYTIEQGEQHGS